MKIVRTFLVLLAFFGLSMSSTTAQDIYVGGKISNRATIWKNGTPQFLTSGSGEIKSVVVVGNDVYASGIEHKTVGGSGFFAGKLWKNGVVEYVLNNGQDESAANSVAVVGDDVYVAGGQGISGKFVGRVWKNGIVEEGYADAGGMFSIFIDGIDIYAAGAKSNYNHAAVWKNGELLYTFDASSNNSVRSVVVDNGNVYTAGYEFVSGNYVSKVWKNGEELYTLGTSGSTYPSAITLSISNGIIYVAGFNKNEDGRAVAKLWTDGTGTDLTDGSVNSYAVSVFVLDGDVYVVGNENTQKIMYWKNDAQNTLVNGSCYANCILVVDNSTGIVQTDNYTTVGVYPNPTSAEFKIESGGLRIERVEILDIYGRNVGVNIPVCPENLGNEIRINISQLSVGVYFVKINTETGEVIKKVLKR
jgi:hypothetical protein